MAIAWPAGVPDKLVRDTYQRTPEDVVARREVAHGPPLRRLLAGSRGGSVKGELSLDETAADLFEAWRRDTLDRGREAFDLTLYDHPAARTVTARFAAQPVTRILPGRTRRVALDMRILPAAPTLPALAALAALDRAAPAAWPGGVPSTLQREPYQASPADRVLRAPERAPARAGLGTRLEGAREQVEIIMTPTELEAFEAWFEVTAAMGVRDISFPVAGGVHTGCFAGPYSVRAAGAHDGWRVSFERYLEARP